MCASAHARRPEVANLEVVLRVPDVCREMDFASEPALKLVGVRVRVCLQAREGGQAKLEIGPSKTPLKMSRPIRFRGPFARFLLSIAHILFFAEWSFRAVGSGI